jgi:hypothetical protein
MLPKLKTNDRDREYKSCPEHIRDKIIFTYLFEGKSHRWLDGNIVGEDASYSRGWVSMGVLHHIGLIHDHKGIFKGQEISNAIRLLEDDEEDFTGVIEALQRFSDINYPYSKQVNSQSDSEINQRVIEELKSYYFEYEEIEYSEGKEKFMLHKVRERNPEVIKNAKKQFMENNGGRLFCEVCGFDFSEVYGKRGEGFIEGHHIKLISELKEGEGTKIEDIAMLCANCHRMAHRKPRISIDKLKLQLLEN